MLDSHSNRHFLIFSDYWLCKIPYKEISALYLLYEDTPPLIFIF